MSGYTAAGEASMIVARTLSTVLSSAVALATTQANWSLVTSASSPPPRDGHVLTNGPGSGLVLFGGWTGYAMLNDTWLLDATGWRQVAVPTSPSPRMYHMMALDLWRNRVVLFGGHPNPPVDLDDTWEWDGAQWALRSPLHRPPARSAGAMDGDPTRGVTVLFSGAFMPADTWEWDGSDWRQVATTHQPPARSHSAMVYDLPRTRMVLFGGVNAGVTFVDTWEYDGTDWLHRAPTQSPPGPSFSMMAADWLRHRVVLFGGGTNGSISGDLWEYDGSTWQQRFPAQLPGARFDGWMVFDIARGRDVLFGGVVGGAQAGDTWEYFSFSLPSVTTIASGCAGSRGTPTPVAGTPWLGDPVRIDIAGAGNGALALLAVGLSSSTWGPLPLPLSLAPLGMPGCALAVSGDASVPMPAVGGVPACTLRLPLVNAFAGLQLFAQALVADAGANAAGFVLSDAIALRLGAR
jgi:hypothetical protein